MGTRRLAQCLHAVLSIPSLWVLPHHPLIGGRNMRNLARAAIAVAVVAFSGCYHATGETGRPESGQKIVRPWAHGFVGGLVPPETVETASQCPNGVARVETYHSILNQLAQFLTFGIYSPMTIEVTCASGGTAGTSGTTIPV